MRDQFPWSGRLRRCKEAAGRLACMVVFAGSLGLLGASLAQAGDIFHVQTSTSTSGVFSAVPIVAKAKGAIFALSASPKHSSSYKRRYKRRYRRNNNRMYRRYRRFRTPPTAPTPWLGAPPPPSSNHRWIYRGRQTSPYASRWKRRSRGAGFVIHEDGYALTLSTLVKRNATFKAHFADGKSYPVKVLGLSGVHGVALLKIELPAGTKLPYLALGSEKPLQLGEGLVALGQDSKEGIQVSTGVVSARSKHIRYGDILRTDASMFRSQRGGPLLNHQGLVVGLGRGGYGSRGGVVHPIDAIRKVLPRLKTKGAPSRIQLGVVIRAVTPDLMRSLKLPTPDGALVSEVIRGGPADQAGVKPGDLIVRFHGSRIDAFSDLLQLVPLVSSGDTVNIVLWRNGQRKTLRATMSPWKAPPARALRPFKRPSLWPFARPIPRTVAPLVPPTSRPAAPASRPAARPPARPAPKPAAKPQDPLSRLGASVHSLSAARMKALQLTGGVDIVGVTAGSAAAENGLRVGDVIAEVNRTPVSSVAQLVDVLQKVPSGDSVLLLVRRNKTALFVAFTLP